MQHEDNSEVHAFVQSNTDEIKIFLKDKAGNPVNELEVNHEKLLHFIIVDERLQKYYHVHPEQTGIYKIWAEFKQNGKIRAFPFVVEIKGED